MGKMRLYGGLGISSIQKVNRCKSGTRSPIANLTEKQCAFFAHRFSGKDVFVAYSHGGKHIANALSEELAESPVVANLATTQGLRTPTVAKSEIVALAPIPLSQARSDGSRRKLSARAADNFLFSPDFAIIFPSQCAASVAP